VRDGRCEQAAAGVAHWHCNLAAEHHAVVQGDRGDRREQGVDLRRDHDVVAVARGRLRAVGDHRDQRPSLGRSCGIRRLRRRRVEEPDRAQVGGDAVGNVGHLWREGWRERVSDRHPVRLDQAEELTTRRQREIGVQVSAGIDVVVDRLVRGKHDEIPARRDDHCRKLPLVEIVRPVREVPAGEIDVAGAEIVDLDPVGVVAVTVVEGRIVAGHELGDQQR